jgi:uncharacterized protein
LEALIQRPSDLKPTDMKKGSAFLAPPTLLAAALLTAWCFIGADALRRDWQYIRTARHFFGALALYTVYGAVLGLFAWLATRLDRLLGQWVAQRRPAWPGRVRAGVYAVVAMLCGISTAFWTFSGEMISQTAVGRWGPYAFLALMGAGAAIASHQLRRLVRALEQGRNALALAVAAVALIASAGLIALDLTLYVSLYPHLHTLLEVCATLLQGVAFSVGLSLLAERSARGQRIVKAIAGVGAVWLALLVVIRPIRAWLDDALRHVWLEEVYAGRALRRMQLIEAVLSNPFHFRGLAMSRVDRLRERYEIKDFKLGVAWQKPLGEPLEFGDRIREIRGERRDFNVVLFYVDTLRADVASDPNIMPNLARFAKDALRFENAYATGSDTLRSLPGITGGNYDLHAEHDNDLLAVARRSEFVSVLFIAQSAYEFLAKLRPSFKFETTVRIADYSPTKTDVWGYGADGPTAGAIVDKALEFMAAHRQERSLMWLFNFDQHNWRELDERYVQDAAKKYAVPEEGPFNWRYRVVARAIDAEFGKLLDGLTRAALADRTIVVFLSDHGEALGRDGFWVHSVFLWECLVRVPLLMRVPGISPRSIEEPVSLADLAPTLARYMEYEPPMRGYQGEDLLGYLVPGRPKRRLPIVMAGASKDTLVRVGQIDDTGRWKLVLSLEAALPELYDLNAPDPDAMTLVEAHPKLTFKMLKSLMQSPVSPRSPKDFEPTLPLP